MKYDLNTYPLWTAVITPMKADGKLDLDSFEKTLREQEAAKNGILLLGSTGESLNISEGERKEVLRFALSLNLKSPLMVGVGGINLPETLDWVKYLETLAVDGYLMVTPLYSKPGPKGQLHWFKTLLDASSRPCMLYNIPGRAAKQLDHWTVQKLAGHKNFWAIKESSGSCGEFSKYVADVRGTSTKVFAGDDNMLAAYYPLGAAGLVSVASNPWPKETHTWVRKVLTNKATLMDARLWEDSSNSLFIASNPIPAKVLMAKLGRISSPTLRPPLTHEEVEDISPLLTSHERIRAWQEAQS